MITFVKSSYRCKAAKRERASQPRKLSKPSVWQYNQLGDIVRYLRATRCKRRAAVYSFLSDKYAVEVKERRMYNFGGVGSYQWMPNLRCYRVQVGAGHINRNRASFNYADCIEIYDIPLH